MRNGKKLPPGQEENEKELELGCKRKLDLDPSILTPVCITVIGVESSILSEAFHRDLSGVEA